MPTKKELETIIFNHIHDGKWHSEEIFQLTAQNILKSLLEAGIQINELPKI